jgi:peptide/nickel transport system permease protein
MVFAVRLGWLPSGGMYDIRDTSGGLGHYKDLGLHLLLPAIALSVRFFIVDMRITRASMMEVLQKDYITMARSKGLAGRKVLTNHALPNAMLPVVTVIGVDMGTLLTGSALVEIIFGWPGVGSLLLESTNSRDYPMLMGIFLIMAVTAVLANLVTDVIYAFLDPRIRY